MRLSVGPHNPGVLLPLKAFRGPARSRRKAQGSPANFLSVHWGPTGQGAGLPAETPKPRQLHKLAVPQPDLFQRQVSPVHAGIRKQPSFSPVAALASCSSGGSTGRSSPAASPSPVLQTRLLSFHSCMAPQSHRSPQLWGLDRVKLNSKVIEMYPLPPA